MLTSVPIIDLAPWFAGTSDGKRGVARQVAAAAEQIGFFKIKNHGIPLAQIDEVFRTAADFFRQSDAVKAHSRAPRSGSARGWHALATKNLAKTIGQNNPPDLREQFYLGPLVSRASEFAHIEGAADLYAENIWPETPAAYRPVFTAYYTALEDLSRSLMRIFALALDQPEHFFDDKIDRHFSTLPANWYPVQNDDPLPAQVRAGEHTDFGSLTILAVNERAGGLQVKLHDGSWADVTAEPGEYIINIGDMMQRWTNDRWLSNLHRVVNPSKSARTSDQRMSIGYFLHPNYDAEIACLPSCTGPGRPAKYPPVMAGEMMRRKLEARAA